MMKCLVFTVTTASMALGCATVFAPRAVEPGAETCGVRDPVSCAVQCDEGTASACATARDGDPTLVDASGRVSKEALQRACDAGHPKACARRAVHLADQGDLDAAYALADRHCDKREWYACDVAAHIQAARPLVRPTDWQPAKASEVAVEATNGQQKPLSYPRDAFVGGRSGTTELLVGVARDGTLVEVRVLRTAGEALDRHAIFAVRRMTWTPARNRDGAVIDSRFRYRVTFVLGDE